MFVDPRPWRVTGSHSVVQNHNCKCHGRIVSGSCDPEHCQTVESTRYRLAECRGGRSKSGYFGEHIAGKGLTDNTAPARHRTALSDSHSVPSKHCPPPPPKRCIPRAPSPSQNPCHACSRHSPHSPSPHPQSTLTSSPPPSAIPAVIAPAATTSSPRPPAPLTPVSDSHPVATHTLPPTTPPAVCPDSPSPPPCIATRPSSLGSASLALSRDGWKRLYPP